MSNRLAILFLAASLLAACQPSAATQPATQAASPANTAATSYPLPGVEPSAYPVTQPQTPLASYPAPAGALTPAAGMVLPYTAYPAPAAGEESNMIQGNFFVDAASLRPTPNGPGQAEVYVEGSLPTPCHEPRVEIQRPNEQNLIKISLYSVAPKDKICTQVLKPFSGAIATLGGYPTGTYTVMVNDTKAGEFTVP